MDSFVSHVGTASTLGKNHGHLHAHGVAASETADAQLKEKCREFESLLYAAMLQAMRKTVQKSDLFYGGHAEDIYTSLLDEEYAKIMAHNERQGIAEVLYEQLRRPQPQHVRKDSQGKEKVLNIQTDRAAREKQGG